MAGALETVAGALAAVTVDGATSWLTKASRRQSTQTVELIKMSRMAPGRSIPILAPCGFDSVGAVELPQLLLKPVDAAA